MSFIIGKWCIQKCIHNLQCSAHTNDTCSHTKNIGIIMLSCSFRHKAVCTVGRSDSLITVGCNCNTNACTADQNTFFTFTCKNCFCYLFGIIRIVTGICGISTVIPGRAPPDILSLPASVHNHHDHIQVLSFSHSPLLYILSEYPLSMPPGIRLSTINIIRGSHDVRPLSAGDS